jgi:hypothetical protein
VYQDRLSLCSLLGMYLELQKRGCLVACRIQVEETVWYFIQVITGLLSMQEPFPLFALCWEVGSFDLSMFVVPLGVRTLVSSARVQEPMG